MLAKVFSATLWGLESRSVEVEIDIARGLPAFEVVGLPDAAIREAKERVRSAVRNSGFDYPMARITANLAPADLRKEGSGFDLALAIGLLIASDQLAQERTEGICFVGELSLDGRLRGVSGILSHALAAAHGDRRSLIVPVENLSEARLVRDVQSIGCATLAEVIAFLKGTFQGWDPTPIPTVKTAVLPDLADIRGQESARRAVEVAAAGGHNLLLTGPPGSGKTMLAERLGGILPPLTEQEALQVNQIYSVAGRFSEVAQTVQRPFRSPHHTISTAGLIGGGRVPRPGEISLAHAGVLFLDELPEFSRSTLEALRQPLESGEVIIGRANATLRYPARFTLIAAANLCPCGRLGSSQSCSCTPHEIARYQSKISGALLDRMDLQVSVMPLTFDELNAPPGESSATVRERVSAARQRQKERLARWGITCNAELRASQLKEACPLSKQARDMMRQAFESLHLSARAHDRLLRVARTIADLAGCDRIEVAQLAEAISYRQTPLAEGS